MSDQCSDCKWKVVPYRGKLCEEKKKCDDYYLMEKEFSFAELKKEDRFLEKINEKMSEKVFYIDPSIKDELQRMYVATSINRNEESRYLPTDMEDIEANKQLASLLEDTQAKKDRVIRIWTGLVLLRNSVSKILRAGERYLYRNFGKELMELKNENIRKVVVEDMLSRVAEKVEKIHTLINTCELIHKNLNDTYYTLARLKEIGESLLHRKTEN